MLSFTEKSTKNRNFSAANRASGQSQPADGRFGFRDMRPEAAFQRKIQEWTGNAQGFVFSPTLEQSPPLQLSVSDAVQFIKVTDADIGKKFKIIANDGVTYSGATLDKIGGGGWYDFTTSAGAKVKVRGQDNILEAAAAPAPAPAAMEVSDDESEFDLDALAAEEGVPRKAVLSAIKDSFGREPRTLRIHSQFGSKTVKKGGPAFDSPDEVDKAPQAMVDHRQKDYGYSGKRIGGDYEDWAGELSDEDREERAGDMVGYLESVDQDIDMDLYDERQLAAAAAVVVTSQISEPLRTEASSDRAAERGRAGLSLIASGEKDEGFGSVFGDKAGARYYPARSKGAARERAHYRGSRSPSPGQEDLDDYL